MPESASRVKQCEERACPFPDCDWTHEYNPDDYDETLSADHRAQLHYEREHAGRIKIQVTLEAEELLGSRNPEDIRARLLDDEDQFGGWDVAYVRTEIVDEADDHSKIGPDESDQDV